MGGCASKPKESDKMEEKPLPQVTPKEVEIDANQTAPAPAEEKEKEEEEAKKEDDEKLNEAPLVDLSDTKQEEEEKKKTTADANAVSVTQEIQDHKVETTPPPVDTKEPASIAKVENLSEQDPPLVTL